MTVFFTILAMISLAMTIISFYAWVDSKDPNYTFPLKAAVVFILLAATSLWQLNASRDRSYAYSFRQAAKDLTQVPAGVLKGADPQATAGWMGPVEEGHSIGCYKTAASLSPEWIPVQFDIHPDKTVSLNPWIALRINTDPDKTTVFSKAAQDLVGACSTMSASGAAARPAQSPDA